MTTSHITIISAIASRMQAHEYDPNRMTTWTGDTPELDLEGVYRFFNRVTDADGSRLEALGYKLPSLSVDDLVVLDGTTYQVAPVGFEKVEVPAPCGYCRRCAIHDDPCGCLEVEAWERKALGVE